MPHLADCAASWRAEDKGCYERPALVLTAEDGAQTLACEGHAGWLLSEALEGQKEATVKAYSGD
ncbi:hypothetical protein OG381_34500 [Streptomyces sp. NBC_00490]|uniref:hypothetical protein n=1 Tax=Streptomyces sp. NBC_00490 TaxID=2903657 RepID=UPI002E17E41C